MTNSLSVRENLPAQAIYEITCTLRDRGPPEPSETPRATSPHGLCATIYHPQLAQGAPSQTRIATSHDA